MPTEVIMPALGMAQETGLLIAWHKQEGETVERGEILMEVETDKTTAEVEAPASGTLANVTAQPGEDIPVGQVIALILAAGEQAPPKQAAASASTEAQSAADEAEPVPASKTATPVAARMAEAHGIDAQQIPSPGKRITRADVEAYVSTMPPRNGNGRLLASPKARRLAQEQGYALAEIDGSGPGGAVLADDVLNFTPAAAAVVPAQSVSSAPAQTPAETSVMWRRMAERLTEAWQTIPHFYLKREVQAEGMIQWRSSLKNRSEIKVTYTDLLVKLVALALREHPHANGTWNGESVVFNDEVNIGLAVAVDEGLIVPVIHNADRLGVTAIAERRQIIVERAQNKKLQPADLQGGTFTISNLGMFGIDEFSAIVNPPQAAILAVGRIAERIVPVDGQPALRSMLTLNLSSDHRAVDGARAARFLDTLANFIEEPLSMLD